MKLFKKESKQKKETRSLPMNKKSRSAFAVYAALVFMLCCCTTTAFAASDPLTVINNLSDFIFGLIRAIGMILLAVLGVGAVGYGIYKLVTKNKEKDTVSSAMSYKDLQDAYWYGNERAFAGYDYRTDPYTFNPNNSAVLGYQAKMQEQMARLTEVVQQYLPDVANQQIMLDDGTLVGKMAPGMNAELGQMQILSERGN